MSTQGTSRNVTAADGAQALASRAPLERSHRVGLGTLISSLSTWLGIRPCRGCTQRAQALDAIAWTGAPLRFGTTMANSLPCRMFTGRCTGFGSRQCVVAPESMSPDAAMIEHCCSGWFQFPWIEICEGQPPKRGCGFCFW